MSLDAPLFIRSDEAFSAVASQIHAIAFPDFDCEQRDGLHRGGGDYFLFRLHRTEVILVCNDVKHWEFFRPERTDFRYYCYQHSLDDDVLAAAQTKLSDAGFACQILVTE